MLLAKIFLTFSLSLLLIAPDKAVAASKYQKRDYDEGSDSPGVVALAIEKTLRKLVEDVDPEIIHEDNKRKITRTIAEGSEKVLRKAKEYDFDLKLLARGVKQSLALADTILKVVSKYYPSARPVQKTVRATTKPLIKLLEIVEEFALDNDDYDYDDEDYDDEDYDDEDEDDEDEDEGEGDDEEGEKKKKKKGKKKKGKGKKKGKRKKKKKSKHSQRTFEVEESVQDSEKTKRKGRKG